MLGNNPRLVSPCIDVPLASVQVERTDSLELIPRARGSVLSTQSCSVPTEYTHMLGGEPVLTRCDSGMCDLADTTDTEHGYLMLGPGPGTKQ